MKFFDKETIEKVRGGYYSAAYFNRTKEILLGEKNFKVVTMQVFQRHEGSILCGVEEVIELLRVGTGYWQEDNSPYPPLTLRGEERGGVKRREWISKWDSLKVESLSDGDKLSSWETVMHITGPYAYFAHLESLYLGILARRSLVATNVRRCVEIAGGKPIIFFADRFDHFLNQEGDGYAAKVGGTAAICTEAMGKWFGEKPVGTLPHALIAVNNGDTVKAVEMFHKYYPEGNLIALVDFENDCVKTSLHVARRFRKKLWGVRIDTAGDLIDKSLDKDTKTQRSKEQKELSGVNPTLVKLVRRALDTEGFDHVKIVVSGGFNQEKIKWFEEEKTPVDMYGVGSALVHGENDFTADVVMVEGKNIAKVGRAVKSNSRLKIIH